MKKAEDSAPEEEMVLCTACDTEKPKSEASIHKLDGCGSMTWMRCKSCANFQAKLTRARISDPVLAISWDELTDEEKREARQQLHAQTGNMYTRSIRQFVEEKKQSSFNAVAGEYLPLSVYRQRGYDEVYDAESRPSLVITYMYVYIYNQCKQNI